jgi:branched-chain amino acid transport system substrate-binding protein
MTGGKAFSEKFTAKYGKIQLYAPYAYDAASAMVAAMRKADSTQPAAYLPVLAKIEHMGVSGKVAFDEKGDIRDGTVTLYQVKGGKWEALEPAAGK